MSSSAPVRLEFADDMFARGHRGVGSPVVTQRVWRLDEAYDEDRLRQVAAALSRGRLSRRLERALLPGARDVWSLSDQPPVVALSHERLPTPGIVGWLHDRQAEHIDPHQGRSWRLAAVDTDDGGSVVSLTVAHAVGDGSSITEAVVRAATDADPIDLPVSPGGLARLRADVADAAGQVRAIGGWAAARSRAKRTGALPVRTPAPPLPEPAPNPEAATWQAPRVVAELDTEAVSDVAARHGGSTNAWFVAVAAELLDGIGHAASGAPIPVSLPVSGFTPGDTRANSTRIARVEVSRDALDHRDLALVKAACKEAYARLDNAGPGLSPIPLPLVQMLPDGLLRRLPQPPGAACLASNVGLLPEPFVEIWGARVRAVATLAAYQRISADDARRLGGGLLAWHAATAARTTLTFIPAEPDRVPDAAAFRRLVLDTLGSWGLGAATW